MPKPSPRKSAGRATEKLPQARLLADENTSHRLVSACRRLVTPFPIVHIADWQDGSWLGLDDAALLMSCAEAGLVLVAFTGRRFPGTRGNCSVPVRTTAGSCTSAAPSRRDSGHQARLLTDFWADEGHAWDWLNRVVYLPKSTSAL